MSNYSQPGYSAASPPADYPQDGYPPQQSRSGCGCGCGGCLGKFLIFLGVIFLLLILACAGSVYWLVKSYIPSSITREQAEVQAISDEIVSIHAAPLEPVAGGRFRMPIVGKSIGEAAIYADKGHNCVLILAVIGDAFGPQFREQIVQIIESDSNEKQGNHNNDERNEELKDVKTSTIEHTIHGEKTNFIVTEGVGVQSGKEKIRVRGTFHSQAGPGILILDAETQVLSRQQVDEMIDSIK
jgi:hypothetical protein